MLRRDASLPFVQFRAGVKSGLLVETPTNNGLTRLMSKSMIKGASQHSAEEIASDIESAGGQIDTFSGNNSHGVSVDILSEDFALGQAMLLDVLLSPAFNQAEVDRERKSQIAAIARQRDHLLSHTLRQGRALLYGESGYGLDPLGSSHLVERFTPNELEAHHRTLTAPGNAVIAIHGEIDTELVHEQFLKTTETWVTPTPDFAQLEFNQLSKPRRNVSKTQKEQSVVALSFHGAPLGQADQTILDVISEALNDMGSRLFLRIRRGTWLGLLRRHAEFSRYHARLFFVLCGNRSGLRETGRGGTYRPGQALGQGGTYRQGTSPGKGKAFRPQENCTAGPRPSSIW